MTYVAEPLAQAVDDVDQEILSLFGVRPPKAATGVNAPPLNARAGWYNTQVDALARAVGLPVFPNEPTYDQSFWQNFVGEVVFILSSQMEQITRQELTSIRALKAYADNVGRFYGTLAGQAAAGSGAQAIAVAETLYNRAEADSLARYNASVAHANQLYNQAVGVAEGLYNRVEGDSVNRYHANLAHANQLYNQAVAQARAEYTASIDHANQLYNQAVAHTNAAVGTLTRDMAAQRNTLEQEIKAGVHEAENFASVAAAAAGAQAVTNVLAQVEPTLKRVATEVDSCLAPLCDEVTPNAKQLGNLGRIAKALESVGFASLLAGLVAEAVRDPERAAADILSVTGWIPGAADDALSFVMG